MLRFLMARIFHGVRAKIAIFPCWEKSGQLDIPSPTNQRRWYFNVRAFRGYIVAEGAFQDRIGNPGTYELSFHCPRGLSGAALLEYPGQQVVGVVIGNRKTSMTVFTETEVLKEGSTTRELVQQEAMHFGIAIKARSVLDLAFRMIGCTVREWLRRHGLV